MSVDKGELQAKMKRLELKVFIKAVPFIPLVIIFGMIFVGTLYLNQITVINAWLFVIWVGLTISVTRLCGPGLMAAYLRLKVVEKKYFER